MARSVRVVLLVPLLVLGACGGEDGAAAAEVACERFVDQRAGAELVHDGPLKGATVEGEGPFVVRSGFSGPAGRGSYVCTVQRDGEGWRLLTLTSS